LAVVAIAVVRIMEGGCDGDAVPQLEAPIVQAMGLGKFVEEVGKDLDGAVCATLR